MKNTLLGKKRETREEDWDEENEYKEYGMSKEEKEKAKKKEMPKEESDSESSVKSQSDSDSSEKEKSSDKKQKESTQFKSIFGNPKDQKPFTGGLFGDLTKKSNSLFGDSLFEKKIESGSLFSSSQPTLTSKPSTLFSSKPLFSFNTNANAMFSNTLFSQVEAKEDEGEDDEEEDANELVQSNSPNPYNPTDKACQMKEQSIYKKKYVKSIENCYMYSKSEGKFLSRGNGFLSLEVAEEGEKRVAAVVLRNALGNKIIEGFLNSKVNAFTFYVKNFKYVACFSFIQKVRSKYEAGRAKVPFQSEADLKEFEREYKSAVEFISTKETKRDEEKKDKEPAPVMQNEADSQKK